MADAAILTPRQRAWRRFAGNRRGWWSLWIFLALFGLSLFAELLSNDKPIVAHYQGEYYFPLWHTYPETTFGGDFRSPTDYLDPFIRQQLSRDGNWALYPPNPYRFDTLNYFAQAANPAPPSADNLLGTDDRGRDVLARLLYGFRVSVLFALALTAIGSLLGILAGAVLEHRQADLLGLAGADEQGWIRRLAAGNDAGDREVARGFGQQGQLVQGRIEGRPGAEIHPDQNSAWRRERSRFSQDGRESALRAIAGESGVSAARETLPRGSSPDGPARRWRSRACRPSGSRYCAAAPHTGRRTRCGPAA